MPNIVKDAKKQEHLHTACGNVNFYTALESNVALFGKVKDTPSLQPSRQLNF